MGAEDYLPKPFDDTLLRARISSSLEKKRLRDLEQLYMKSMEHELEIGRQIQKKFLPASFRKWKAGKLPHTSRRLTKSPVIFMMHFSCRMETWYAWWGMCAIKE